MNKRRIIFCNIGWMKYYKGVGKKDQIVHGGGYVEKMAPGMSVVISVHA